MSGSELLRSVVPETAAAVQRSAGNAAMAAWLVGPAAGRPTEPGTAHRDLDAGAAVAVPGGLRDGNGFAGDVPVQRAETRTESESEAASSGGWKGEGGLGLTPEDSRKADDFLGVARENESRISGSLQKMAAGMEGVKFIGWDYKLKGEESLKRKLASVLRDNPMLSTEEAIRDIRDSVRYTIELTDDGYSNGSEDVMQWLQGNGYEPVVVRNTWGNERGYKGVNSNWKDSSTGHVFELQFHTSHSFGAKMATHHLYEEARLFPPGKQRDEATAKMGDVYAGVPVPSGAPEVGSKVRGSLG